jgi:hypothetical protein
MTEHLLSEEERISKELQSASPIQTAEDVRVKIYCGKHILKQIGKDFLCKLQEVSEFLPVRI